MNKLAITTAGATFGELIQVKLHGTNAKGDVIVKLRTVDEPGNVTDMLINLVNLEYVVDTLRKRVNEQ